VTAAADGTGRGPRPVQVSARQPKAIHSALIVLEEVARCGPGVTARAVSDNLGLPRATAYRLLNLLVQEEYLVRLPDLRGFALGRRVARLAEAASSEPTVRVPRAAMTVLGGMRSRFRGGVTLVGYLDDRIQLLDVDPDYPLSDPRRIVEELPASAIGRVLLAERERRRDTSTSSGRDSLEEILRLGYTTQSGQFRTGFGCIAMPVRDGDGALVAGLALSTTSAQLLEPRSMVELLHDGVGSLAPLLA